MTCRVSYFGRSQCLVDFVRNQTYTYRLWVYLPASELYATVGFAKATATVSVDWPVAPADAVSYTHLTLPTSDLV